MSHGYPPCPRCESDERIRAALFDDKRINWSTYSDDEMEKVAIQADKYGLLKVLNKVRRASMRRFLKEMGQ